MCFIVFADPLVYCPIGVTIDSLLVPRGSEIRDLLLDGLVDSRFQFRSVAKHEENLHPYEERSEKDSLNQVIEQSWCATLKDSMSDELRDPAEEMNSDSPVIGLRSVSRGKIVRSGSTSNKYRRQHCSSDGFQ